MGNSITTENAELAPLPPAVFLHARARLPIEDAERFSNLERIGRQDQVLSILQLLEPRLRRLAVLVTGGVPMINGDIGIGQLVPLAFMGEGIGRLLSIVLAIASAPDGIVLIDEIENGLHHSVMEEVWKAVGLAASQSETQIFATTHSWECIRAAHLALKTSQTHVFRLFRLERGKEEIQSVGYDQEALMAAMEFGLETR
jgi:hypothetical protein